MPRALTAVTAGDHIDWTTTSPEAIKFTDWSKFVQKARNWPDFLMSVMISKVLSISARVMLPLLPYLMSPRASSAIATSMLPTTAVSLSAALPLYFGSIRAVQLVIASLPPTRSGRTPSVSALNTVGTIVSQSVGSLANFLPSGPSQNPVMTGESPWFGIGLPLGNLPVVNIDKVLSQSL